jgi:hypothetical protein
MPALLESRNFLRIEGDITVPSPNVGDGQSVKVLKSLRPAVCQPSLELLRSFLRWSSHTARFRSAQDLRIYLANRVSRIGRTQDSLSHCLDSLSGSVRSSIEQPVQPGTKRLPERREGPERLALLLVITLFSPLLKPWECAPDEEDNCGQNEKRNENDGNREPWAVCRVRFQPLRVPSCSIWPMHPRQRLWCVSVRTYRIDQPGQRHEENAENGL